jgi:hypothetical protein
MNELTAAQRDYLNWIKLTMPEFYADQVQPYLSEASLGSIGATESGGTFSNILNSITNALPSLANTYAQYRAQEDALEQRTLEMQRAYPITTAGSLSQYMPYLLIGAAALGVLFFATR